MDISQDYRFFITLPNASQPTQFYPAISLTKWKKDTYKDECFFRTEFETELVIDDYDLFKELWELEQDRCRCNALPIRIDKCCCGVWTENYHRGIFAFVDGEWDPERCKVTFPLRDQDEYSCLLDNWDNERNFLEIEDRVSINSIFGDVVCLEEDQIGIFDSPHDIDVIYPIAVASAPTGYSLYQIIIKNFGGSSDPMIRAFAVYCRVESSIQPPNTSGWTFDGTIWHTPLITSSSSTYDVASNTYTYDYIDLETDNGITFQSFLEYYLSDCFDCIVSNFFNINPDNTAPDNYEYQCAVKDFHEIIMFQSAEIILRLDQGSQAGGTQAGLKKFKDFWENLNKLIPLCMYVDDDTGCLRIEHCSYLDSLAKGKRLDLLDPKFIKYLIGTGNYTVDPVDIPRTQTWKYATESTQRDFAFSLIEYDPDCSTDQDDIKDEEITIKCFNNDLTRIYRNSDFQYVEAELNNITMISTIGGLINSTIGINGESVLNGAFSLTHLAKYNLRKRPQCFGIVNGVQTEFLSTAKIRKLPTIEIPMSCELYEALSVERDNVITKLGLCDIASMEREEPSCMVSLELVY